MTKKMILNLNDVERVVAATSLVKMVELAEENMADVIKEGADPQNALERLADARRMAEVFKTNPPTVELLPFEAHILFNALRCLFLIAKNDLSRIGNGEPEMFVGALQTIAICGRLIDTICTKGEALAAEEEEVAAANEQRKAA